jgi:hypothetical protein
LVTHWKFGTIDSHRFACSIKGYTLPNSEQIRYVQNELLISQEVENEIIIMHPETGEFYCLNGIASVVWPLLATGQSVTDVVQLIDEGMQIGPSDIGKDIQVFFDRMSEQGLITPVDP